MKQQSYVKPPLYCMFYDTSSSLNLLLHLIFFLLFFNVFLTKMRTTEALVKLPPNVTVPAVIAFGDSIVDAGNNNDLQTLAKSNFPPYGVDFYGGIPTGRFSDGKVPADLLAEELGIKSIIPAYRDPNLNPEDLLSGVTFASGGCGYYSLTNKLALAISLEDQFKLFEEYKEKLKEMVGEERRDFIVANSIFIVVVGSNDIANTYFSIPTLRLQYDVASYTTLMADSASDFATKLYGSGARIIGVFGAPPIGCVPSQRTIAGGLHRDCAENYNEAAKLFNAKLSKNLGSLSRTLPGSKFVYIDVYYPLLDLIQNPSKYGFEVVDRGCCGTGKIEAAVFCNSATSSICSNVNAHVFWDGYHPTERAYRILVSQIANNYVPKFL